MTNSIRRGRQARDIVINARGSGLSQAEAQHGLNKAWGIRRDKLDHITVIGDNYFLIKGN